MSNAYKMCQSCGMPMKKDPAKGGTNMDGTKSEKYCSYCYQNGGFRWADCTAEQMQEFCQKKLQEMGFPGFVAKWFTKGIPKLERWNKKQP
jgi:hypothetical protein